MLWPRWVHTGVPLILFFVAPTHPKNRSLLRRAALALAGESFIRLLCRMTGVAEITGSEQPIVYAIQVTGRLQEEWSGWLGDMTIAYEESGDGCPRTTIIGPVADQAALRGLLNKLWNLNLTLISLRQVQAEQPEPKGAAQAT